jgi:hypothetical protein
LPIEKGGISTGEDMCYTENKTRKTMLVCKVVPNKETGCIGLLEDFKQSYENKGGIDFVSPQQNQKSHNKK